MAVRCVLGFYFLLSTHCAAASEASFLPRDKFPDVGDPTPNPNSDALDIVDSGFQDSVPDIVPENYPHDVFWQSGGVRVRAENLNQEGQRIYQHFLHYERQEQRAFIWRTLHLENINFVHLGTENPMIQPARTKDITEEDMFETLNLKLWGFDTPEETRTLSRSALDVLPKLLDDLDWNLFAVNAFVNEEQFAPLYNDMPGASTSGNNAASVAFNDPRYRDSDAVVNYRANLRTLFMESLHLLGKTADEESAGLLSEHNTEFCLPSQKEGSWSSQEVEEVLLSFGSYRTRHGGSATQIDAVPCSPSPPRRCVKPSAQETATTLLAIY